MNASHYLGRKEDAGQAIAKICRLNGIAAPKHEILKWESEPDQGISAVWAYPGMRRNLVILAMAWFR
jgi:hypothetical protein